MRKDTERLLDISEAIAKIERYAVLGKAKFEEDELIQTWILHQFQVIGEAASSLSDEMRVKHDKVEWRDIADFRNLLVHEYFRVDLDVVWSIVEKRLPGLKADIAEIIKQES